jgi:hypothetical protein
MVWNLQYDKRLCRPHSPTPLSFHAAKWTMLEAFQSGWSRLGQLVSIFPVLQLQRYRKTIRLRVDWTKLYFRGWWLLRPEESTGTIGPNSRQLSSTLLRRIDIPNGSRVTIFDSSTYCHHDRLEDRSLPTRGTSTWSEDITTPHAVLEEALSKIVPASYSAPARGNDLPQSQALPFSPSSPPWGRLRALQEYSRERGSCSPDRKVPIS